MGRIWIPGGGGSADLDAVTASAEEVLEGKVIVNKEGESVIGTMPNESGEISVPTNGSVLIPEGYHDGTYYAKNTQATMAGKTVTPSASSQTVSCSGKLMTGNVVVSAIPSSYVKLADGTTSFDFATISEMLGGVVAKYVKYSGSSFALSDIDVKYVDGLPYVNGHGDNQMYGIVFKNPIYVYQLSEIGAIVNSSSSLLYCFGLIKTDKTLWGWMNGSMPGSGEIELTCNFSDRGISPGASDLAYIFIGLNGKSSSTKGVVQTLKSIKFTKA